jgi:hypothetical protein
VSGESRGEECERLKIEKILRADRNFRQYGTTHRGTVEYSTEQCSRQRSTEQHTVAQQREKKEIYT